MSLGKKPIKVFKSQEQLNEYAKYYQHLLFLDHWFIKFELVDRLMSINNSDKLACGYCGCEFLTKEGVIRIYNGNLEFDNDFPYIAELTLIHELLHLKFMILFPAKEEIESDLPMNNLSPIEQNIIHSNIEEISKIILMTKYNLDYDYFRS